MQYPEDFSVESRASVTAEKLRAGREYDRAREHPRANNFDLERDLRKYILRQFAAFVREAGKLGLCGAWQVDEVEKSSLEFLRLATIAAVHEKGHDKYGRDLGGSWIDNWGGSIASAVRREFEKSEEWRQFQDTLLQVAENQAKPTFVQSETERTKGRRGYRAEVKAWMNQEGLATVAEAAKFLGVSVSSLKSMMSDRGERRYSEETLTRVLDIIHDHR